MTLPVLELGSTYQFTWTSSVAPDAAPTFKVQDGRTEAIVASITAVSSDTTNYYALYTLPASEGFYVAEWFALKTFQGSAYQFVRRFGFRVGQTTPVT